MTKISKEIIERQKEWNRKNKDRRTKYNKTYRGREEIKIREAKYHHQRWISRAEIQNKTEGLAKIVKNLYLHSFSPSEISHLLNVQVNSINAICRNYNWDDEIKFCRICYQETKIHLTCDVCNSGIHDMEKVVDVKHIANFVNFPDDVQEKRLGLYRMIGDKKMCRYCEEFNKNK